MGGSQIWLDTTEKLSVHEMLKAICVVSANDCTVAMAEYISGSEEQFVEQMNKKANELRMNDTTFKNCHGIDEDDHITSAYDISLMSRELLLNHPKIKEYTTIWMDSLRNGKSELVNTNKLVRNYPGCTGLKTGSTSLALYNLSASATRDNLSLIAVIMRAPNPKTRFQDATKLLNYGFQNYTYKNLGSKNEIIDNIPVNKGIENNISCILENDSGIIIPKTQESKIKIDISLPKSVNAPITKGDYIGKITYLLDDKILKESNIIASKSIKKETFLNTNNYLLKRLFTLFR